MNNSNPLSSGAAFVLIIFALALAILSGVLGFAGAEMSNSFDHQEAFTGLVSTGFSAIGLLVSAGILSHFAPKAK